MIFNRKNKKLKTYLALLEELGQKEFIMPIELIRLGNQFAALGDPKLLKKSLLAGGFLNHESLHVKRVIAIAFRCLQEFDDSDINASMKRFLEDSSYWLVYDAIWFFKEAKTSDPEVIQIIENLAVNTKLSEGQLAETSPSSDPMVNMKWMADETLALLK